MVVITWFNQNTKQPYTRLYSFVPILDLRVGFENGYGHLCISILILDDHKFISYDKYRDMLYSSEKPKENKKSKIKRFIKYVSNFK